MRSALAALLLLLAVPAQAQVSFDRPPTQGGLSVGRTAPGSSVTLDGRKLRVGPDGVFVIGFGRDATAGKLDVVGPDGKHETVALKITTRKFDIQRINGLPEEQVSPNPALVARINDENAQVARARVVDSAEALFRAGFIWPVTGPISGVYGSQRILNGQARAPHWGVDIAVPTGTPVRATADGIVTVAHEDMFLTGKTLLLDHGYGVNSVYFHMSRIDVKVGARVKQGQSLGLSGATGRATGPHLHWGLNLFDVRLDPVLVVPPMPKSTAP